MLGLRRFCWRNSMIYLAIKSSRERYPEGRIKYLEAILKEIKIYYHRRITITSKYHNLKKG